MRLPTIVRQKDREQTSSTAGNKKIGDSKTAMGVALTLLAAGIIVQVTDGLELFGHNSVVPLIIGGIVIIIGLCIVFVMRRIDAAHRNSKDTPVI